MSKYENCCQCGQYINTENNEFVAIHMHNGEEFSAHLGNCASWYHSANGVEIKSMHNIKPTRPH